MASSCQIVALRRRNSGMGRWLAGVSAGAASLVLATLPATVRAQAVNGNPTPQFGIGSISRSTPGLDSVFVDGSEALIDWTASDSGGVFLPEGNTLRFIYDASTPYTVLNRVTDTAVGGPLSIAGTVESNTLGQIWFYNAGGWVVGAKGVFNVGSLVLTSLPITVDPAGPGARLYGDKGEIRFGTALDPKSSVSVQSGASIRVTMAESSYVALVAPRVDQGGTVATNGSAAYVGAEAATMTINGGLFDIIVDSGTDDDVGVSHTGSTTFPANGGSTDTNRGIYLVAVPKNQAMTAVVSGRLGYDSATTASIVNGSIVLSAGHNVAGGAVVAGSGSGTNASLALSNLSVGSKGFTTDLLGSATGNITLDATTGNSSFNGSVSLEAQGNIVATIDNARSVSVEGGLSLTSTNGAKAGNVSASVAGNGGLFVTGSLDLLSLAEGAIQTDPSNGDALQAGSVGEDAVSGNVSLTVNSGNVFAGATRVESSATSGVGELSTGSATSGNATIAVTQPTGSGRDVGLGSVTVSSAASDGFFSLQQSNTGGSAAAGNASLSVTGGTFDSTSLTLDSDATTYAGSDGTALNASAGTVGIAFTNLDAEFQTGAISATNSASASDGGIAALGNIAVAFDNASASTDGSFGEINLISRARGQFIAPNAVSLSLTNKAALDTLGSDINILASGDLATGTQRSGSLSVLLDGSSLAAGSLNAITAARGSGSGTSALSGNVSAIIRNGSNVALGIGAEFDSIAVGGSGVNGGSGTGGSVGFVLADSSFAGDLGLQSRGTAGSRSDATGASGTGTGGTLSFAQTGKTASLTAEDVTLSTLGRGGQPAISARTSLIGQAGDGASGIGGTSTFSIADGTFTTTTLSVDANGEGADGLNPGGSAPGAGGLGLGGTARLNVTGGLLSAGRILVAASGFGGDGARAENSTDGGTGGAGTGGSASALLTGGAVRTEALLVEANGNKSFFDPDIDAVSYFGYGGYEQFGLLQPGTGGVGTGGIALVTVNGGAVIPAVPYRDIPPSVRASAIGEGGPGGYANSNSSGTAVASGSGGDGVGGTATIRYLSGNFDAAGISADASGLGGLTGRAVSSAEEADIAGNGGNGTGGKAAFEIAADLGQRTSLNALRSVNVRADGIGAAGEKGVAGGRGGNGTGGDAKLATSVGTTSLANVTVSALGTGGIGGSGFIGGNGGNGGMGTGGQVQLGADGFGAQLIVQSPVLLATGTGGIGGEGGSGTDGQDAAGNGGSGGTGRGGTISFAASNLGQVAVSGSTAGSTFSALGLGGNGGLGGNSAIFFGATLGNGGNGGSGFGGTIDALAASGGGLAFDSLTLSVNGIGGAGGGRVSGSSSGTLSPSLGGTGGAGQGGSISLVSTDFRSSLAAAALSASADGLGGAGADGAGYTASGQSTDGSAGGNGTGGTITLLADLEGTLELAAKAGNLSLSAPGLGGDGGSAQDAIGSDGAAGGNGGASGSGTGGSIQLTAGALATASLGLFGTTTIDTGGTGGRAGGGGDGAPTFTPATVGGKGGNTGLAQAGTGGTVNFVANGGVLNLAALDVKAQGITQYRNLAGTGGSGPGGSGAPGSNVVVLPTGGTIGFAASDDLGGNPGQIKAGAVTANVTSSELFVGLGFSSLAGAGSISLANSATATDGGIRFGSFEGNASGNATVDPAIAISVTAGNIAIDTNLTLFAGGNVAFDLSDGTGLSASSASVNTFSGIAITGEGTGRFSAGSIDLFSFGSTAVASTGCATATCRPLEASGTLSIDAFGDFSLSGPVELAGLGSLEVYAGNNLTSDTGSRYFSNGNVEVRAGNDATIRNITGANVIAEAGAVKDGGYLYFNGLLTLGEVEGGGLFSASGTLDLNSGGTVRTLDGATFTAGSSIGLHSGNDILVGFGNGFTANTGLPSTPGGVVFAAGGQTIEYSLASTDIATLSFGGGTTVDAGSGGIALSGEAIDARFASFAGASFQADVLTTLAQSDTRRTDGGSLDPDCLEGAICIGNVTATGLVSIGTGAAVPLDIRATGTISGASLDLRATGDLTFGGLESTAQLASTNSLSIRSLAGGIALLGGSEVRGGTVRLSAATNLSGTGNIEATSDDIGLSIGGDIDASSIIAARELTTATDASGEAEGTFSTPGSFRTGVLSLASLTDLFASSEVAVGALSLGRFNGSFEAGGALRVGTSSAVGNLSLIAGTTATFDDLVTDGNLSITAATIAGANARAGGTLSITGTDLAADLLQSAGDLTLTITNQIALGSAESTGGAVSIDPVLLTFDAITAANDITLVGGTITGGTLDAGTSIDVTATGALTLDSANAGTTLTLRADSLGTGALTAGTDLALIVAHGTVLTGSASAGGNAAITGQDLSATSFDVIGNLSLTLTGAAALSGLVTVGGDFSSTAASFGFGTIDAGAGAIFGGGSVTGGNVTAGGAISASLGGIATFGTLTSGLSLEISAQSIFADSLLADSLDITATNAVTLDSARTTSGLTISAQSLTVPSLESGGDLSLTIANTATLGTVTSGGSVAINPALLTFDAITAADGITLSGGTITGGTLDAGTDFDVNATGALTLTLARAGGNFSLAADSLRSGLLESGGDLTLSAVGSITLSDLANAGGSLSASFTTLDFVELNALGQLDLAGGSMTGRGVTAGLDANIALTGAYAVAGASFGGNLILGAQTVSGAAIDTIGNADVTVAGRSSLFGYSAGGTLSLVAGQLSAEALYGGNVDARIAGTATLTSGDVGTGGNFALSAASLDAGTLHAGNNLSLTTTGAINVTSEATAGGNLTISSASLAAPTLHADGGMDLNVTNRAVIGFAHAGQTISATAASFSFEDFSANDISVNAGSIDQGGLRALNALTVTATGSASIGAFAGGALTIAARDLNTSVVQSSGGNISLSATSVASISDVSALAGDITINAGRLILGSAKASGQIQLGALVIDNFGKVEAGTSAFISATDAIAIGEVFAGGDVSLAGGNIDALAVNAGGLANYTGGDVRVGSTTGTTANVAARNFSFDRLTATGDIVIQASAGLTGGSIDTAGNLDLVVGGTATLDIASANGGIGAQFGTLTANLLTAGGLLDLTGVDLSLTNATAGTGTTIALTGDFVGNSLTSGGMITLSSRNGSSSTMTAGGDIALTIADTASLGTITSTGGSVVIDPALLTFDAISANQAISLAGGEIIGGTLAAGTSIDVTATGGLTLTSATSGTSMALTAASLNAPTLSAGTDLVIQTSGGVDIGSQVTAGRTIAITADTLTAPLIQANGNLGITITGLADVTTLRSLSGNVSSQAGTLQFDGVSAGGRVRLLGGNLNGTTVTSGTATTLSVTNALSVDTVTAGTSATINGNAVTANTVIAGTFTDFDGSTIQVGTTQAGTTAFVDSRNFTFDRMDAGQSVEILAFRNVTGGTINAGTTLDISARGDVVLDGATAGGQITIGAANLATLTVNGGAGLSLTVTNAVDLETVDVLGAFDLTAATLSLGTSQSGLDSTLGLTGNAVIGSMAAGTGAVPGPASVVVTTGGDLTTGSLAATSGISLAATGALRLDAAVAGDGLSLSGGTINSGDLRAGSDITLASAGASLIGSATAQGRFMADVGALDFTLVDAADAVDITSLAGIGGGDIRSGASITVAASGPIAIRDASASGGIALATGPASSIAARALVAGGAIGIEGGDVVLSSIGAGGDFNATVQSLASPTIAVTGNFTVTGTGAVEIGTAAADGALAITSQTLTFTRMTAGSGIDLASAGDVTGGDIVASGTIRVNTGSARFGYGTLDGGDIAIVAGSVAGGAIRARTGDLNLSAGGDASLGAIDATGNVALDAQGLSFGSVRAGGAFGTTNRAMRGNAIDAGEDVVISSQGDVALSGLSGRTARISSAGIVNIASLQLSGPVTVFANAVGLDAVGDLAIQSISANKGDVAVSAGGSITGDSIAALGDIDLLARNGNVEIGALSAGYAGAFSDAVRPKGTVSSGVVGQGNINIVASGDIVLNDVADAARAFTMDAGGTIRINALATGATMDLTSADLEIGAAARLGETAHTDAITLRNTGQGPLRLGDNLATTASGYAISQAEFARIRSRGDLTIRANQALLVGDLAVVAQAGTAQGQIGETGTLSLRSGSLASFLGALAMTNATGNTLAIGSQTGVFLDAASGSIRLADGEARAGTLAISGSGIAMVTRGALADIAQLTDTALITDRLGLNDGVADGRILVEADAISLRSDREVYIQNTALGTRLDDRRGLVANSLRIGSRDGSQLDIVINGIVNGQVGVDAIEQIGFDESFTDLSSVNGCVILSANTCNKLPFEIIELRDVVEEVLKTDPADEALQIVDSFTKTSLIQLNQIAPAGFEPLIDEPVTGTGNDDLLGEGKAQGE